MNWQTLLRSEFFWETVIGVWVTQIVTTAIVVAKSPKTGILWRVIRALHGLLDKVDPPSSALVLLVALGSLRLTTSCAGTFEESSGKFALATPRKSADPALCQQISSRAKWEKAGAAALGLLAGGSGVATWPIESDNGKVGLAISAGVLAAGGVFVLTLWESDAAAYIEAGCAAPKEQVK